MSVSTKQKKITNNSEEFAQLMYGDKELRWYQTAAAEETIAHFNAGIKRVGLVKPTGCHALNEKILLADGSLKNSQDITITDKLLGPDGTIRNVTELVTGQQQMVKVVPKKGESFVVNLDHILSLQTVCTGGRSPYYDGTEIVNISIKDYLTKSKWWKSLHKLYKSGPLEFHNDVSLTMNSYTLGLLLGDGHFKKTGLAITLNDTDEDIHEYIVSEAVNYGVSTRISQEPSNCTTYYFARHIDSNKAFSKFDSNPMLQDIRDLGLGEAKATDKFIPDSYKRSSINDRMDLLAGLLDSDGHLTNKCFEFSSSSITLRDDTMFVARSLGFRATPSEYFNKKYETTYYKLMISGDTDTIPTRAVNKQASPRKQKKSHLKSGFTIELLDTQSYYGWTVDSDSLYMMGDFHATHNCGKTISFLALCEQPRLKSALGVSNRKLRVLLIAAKHTLLDQAKAATIADSEVEYIYQTVASEIPDDVIKQGWDLTIIDEGHGEACMSIQYKLEEMGEIPIILVTATPDRADGVLIKVEVYVEPLSRELAVEMGYISPTTIHSFVDHYGTTNRVDIVKSILDEHWQELGQFLIFMRTKAECSVINDYCIELGMVTTALVQDTKQQTSNKLELFNRGEIQGIVSCTKISEGVDLVGCVDVIFGLTVGSFPKLSQNIGRSVRPDSPSTVWEIVDMFKENNLDTTVVVGEPVAHTLSYYQGGEWISGDFKNQEDWS